MTNDYGNYPLSREMEHRLESFWELLLTWNARINLTGARSVSELRGEHFPDAVSMARMVPAGSTVVDVGAGGGLPGIPFALLRADCRVSLVEPRAKRVAFLRTAVRSLGIEAAVVCGRAEELPAGGHDVASSRATFPPDEWIVVGRVLAPSILVFAARGGDVAVPPGLRLEQELAYRSGAGHPRWLGLIRGSP